MLLLTPTVIHELKIYSHKQFLYGKQKWDCKNKSDPFKNYYYPPQVLNAKLLPYKTPKSVKQKWNEFF